MRKEFVISVPDLENHTLSPRSPMFPPTETLSPPQGIILFTEWCVGGAGKPELFSGLEWGLRNRPSTTNGVLGMRVFGKKPWAVFGANPQTPASVPKSVPYRPHTHLLRTI